MTFDLAQMIADLDAGSVGPWEDAFDDDTHEIRIDSNSRLICVTGNVFDRENNPEVVEANARRIARVPAMEAEIIRLTARVAEYDRSCADLVAHWDSTDWVNKPHTGEKIAAIRAALSTPIEEPKT